MSKFLIGVLVGAVIGVIFAGYWAYLAAGSIPIIGGLITAQIRKRAKAVLPDLSSDSPQKFLSRNPYDKQHHQHNGSK